MTYVSEKAYQAQLAALEDKILAKLVKQAKDDFYTFVKLMAPTVLPEDFCDGRHIELICEELQDVEASVWDKTRDPKRIQLWLPPGSMKSKIASNLFPSWCLGRHPNWCFLAIGSDFEFAVDNFGRPTKDLIESDRYQAIFPGTVLKKDVQSAGRWDTTMKGRFVARGAGQNIAGRRAHISICDDVITEQASKSDLQKINNWYRKGLRTRLLPRGAEIIINTRWFLEDLSGFMIKVDANSPRPWKVIKLPALLTIEASTMLREGLPATTLAYEPGTSFWPEFWPTSVLEEKKNSMPPSEWAALYMQEPISEEGGIVKKQHFKIWEEEKAPPCKYVLVSMDTAFSTKETADFSAFSVWGVFNQEFDSFDGGKVNQDCLILLSAGRGRWDFAELCNKAQELNANFMPDFFIIEDKASGQSLITEMRKRSLPILAYMPEKDKAYRLQACTPYFQASRIWVPKDKDWAEELVSEVIAFPKAPNDDLTDTTSQAILWMRDSYKIDNDGFTNQWEDEQNRLPRKTYWSALTGT